jgi:hypothetical protein
MSVDRVIPTPEGGEGDDPSPEDLVTITRAELDALLVRSTAGAPDSTVDDRSSVATLGLEALDDVESDRTREPLETRRRISRPDSGVRPDDREAFLTQEIASRDQRVADLERTCRTALRDRALAVALCGLPLVTGAAPQLIKLWRDDFDVYEENGEYRVSARDGRTVEQTVSDWLTRTEYAHFCLPSSRGGAGLKEGHRPATPGAADRAPRNLGESIVMQWRKDALARTSDPAKPIGLGRQRH